MTELISSIGNVEVISPSTSAKIILLDQKIKELQEIQDEIKKALLEEMKAKGIKKIDTETLIISYVEPTDKEDFDKKKFKSEHRVLYDSYVKMTPVKESIRIKVK